MDRLYAFQYLYRDASNYKIFGEVFLKGEKPTHFEIFIGNMLKDGMYFIPEQLDIPPLQREMSQYADEFPTEDDHV